MPPPRFTIRLPSAQEEERARAFTVHKNYISSIAAYLLDQYGTPPELLGRLVAEQRSGRSYRNLHTASDLGADSIERYLTISWASELQLRLGGSRESATLRYSNVWAPVHAYYAVYMSMQAWFASNQMPHLVDDHSSSLRTIASEVKSRRLFPLPWAVTCTGCPQLGEVEFHQVPTEEDLARPFQILSTPSPQTFWPRYCKMLQTTRQRRLEWNFREWKKSRGRKAMRKNEKRKVAKKLLPTTMFDFFWRLRVRSNYRDVSSFLTWNVAELEQQEFHDSVVTVTDATCALFESLLVAKGGRSLYRRLVNEFLDSTGGMLGEVMVFLENRRDVILG